MNLTLDGTQLADLLHVAVVHALGDPAKETLVKEVVAYLVNPRSGYGGRAEPSVLREALNNAAQRVATKLVEDRLANDAEFIAEVTRLHTDAFQRLFIGESREKLVEKLSQAMGKALSADNY